MRKIHKKLPDHVVHTVKLGRLINIVDISTDIKKLCKSKDGTGWDVHFPSKGPVLRKKFSLQKFRNGNVNIPV